MVEPSHFSSLSVSILSATLWARCCYGSCFRDQGVEAHIRVTQLESGRTKLTPKRCLFSPWQSVADESLGEFSQLL